MPSKKLQEVVDYCWSHSFLDVFHEFFDDHAEAFEGNSPIQFMCRPKLIFVEAPRTMAQGEHNLEYYDLFQKYLKLYEVKSLYSAFYVHV